MTTTPASAAAPPSASRYAAHTAAAATAHTAGLDDRGPWPDLRATTYDDAEAARTVQQHLRVQYLALCLSFALYGLPDPDTLPDDVVTAARRFMHEKVVEVTHETLVDFAFNFEFLLDLARATHTRHDLTTDHALGDLCSVTPEHADYVLVATSLKQFLRLAGRAHQGTRSALMDDRRNEEVGSPEHLAATRAWTLHLLTRHDGSDPEILSVLTLNRRNYLHRQNEANSTVAAWQRALHHHPLTADAWTAGLTLDEAGALASAGNLDSDTLQTLAAMRA